MAINNTQELRDLLLEAIEKVEKGTMETKVAGAIVGLSGQVIKTCMLDISYAKVKSVLSGKEISSLGLSAPKKLPGK